MNMLISDSRCNDCYGSGERLYFKGANDNDGTVETCESCQGTGREMSELARELFAVLKKYFDIIPKGR